MKEHNKPYEDIDKEYHSILDKLTIENFNRALGDCLENGICVNCGGAASEFSNDLSRDEYFISGFCEKCQDEVFEDPDLDYLDEEELTPEQEKYLLEMDYQDYITDTMESQGVCCHCGRTKEFCAC